MRASDGEKKGRPNADNMGGARFIPPPDGRRAASEAYVNDSRGQEGPVFVGCVLKKGVVKPNARLIVIMPIGELLCVFLKKILPGMC